MREKRKGYGLTVSIGYGNNREERGKVNGKEIVKVNNLHELEKVSNNQIVVLGNIGKKKKLEIAKKALDKKIEILI